MGENISQFQIRKEANVQSSRRTTETEYQENKVISQQMGK